MTEELEKEAEEYFKSICGDYNEEYERTGKRHYFVGFDIKNAYLAGAEPREKRIAELEKENTELKDEVRKLKLLVSSLVYEINQIWDINEMDDDLRRCAEKIDREVQLSKMAEDNRMVISALGFAIVPPKPKLYVKEV
jgi:predicted RNase H-like nuclease (RuvC/YqgF family)